MSRITFRPVMTTFGEYFIITLYKEEPSCTYHLTWWHLFGRNNTGKREIHDRASALIAYTDLVKMIAEKIPYFTNRELPELPEPQPRVKPELDGDIPPCRLN